MQESENDKIKTGARNSAEDRARIRQLRSHGREIDRITRELEPDDEDAPKFYDGSADDRLAYFGEAVKALGDGRVGGYLVRYSDPHTPDLTGDFFDHDTDYGVEDGATLPVYYQHGMDSKLKNRRVGRGKVRYDEAGLWLEAQLEMRDEYERMIYGLAESGKLGWSSGAAGHLVDREQVGKSYRIVSWPIGEASLTPTPAEPRNTAVPIKSLAPADLAPAVDFQQTDEAGEDKPVTEAASNKSLPVLESNVKGDKMSDELDIKSVVAQEVREAVKAAFAELPITNGGGVQVVKDEADQPFASFGEQLQAVKAFAVSNGLVHDPRLDSKNVKQLGMNEGLGSEGGFLVQQDFASELLKRSYELGVLASRVRRIPISANANGIKINAVAENSRVTGSRWGGVSVGWVPEAGASTAAMPAFRQIQLDLKKLRGLAYATEELLQDKPALESIIMQAFSEEFAYELDNAILRGTGAGQPMGILPSPAAITVARFGGPATISHEDIVNMYSRAWARGRANSIWVYNQDCEPQLFTMGLTVGAGGTPSFMPPGGLTSAPYATLMGRPAIAIEQASTLGTLGDIALLDLSQYVMIDKGGMNAASSVHVAFLTDQTAFKFVYRVDGQPVWSAPLTPATGSANTLSPFVFLAA